MKPFESFETFYPYYLSEHRDGTCRLLHFIGTTGVIAVAIMAALKGDWRYLLLTPVIGYGFAWVGHFFFEHNRPATFTYPSWSLRGDFVMFADILLGRVPLLGSLPESHFAEQIRPYQLDQPTSDSGA